MGEQQRNIAAESAGAACLAFALYLATCARGVQWGDPAKLALYVWNFSPSLNPEAHLGALVWAWPFARLPIEPFAFRITLASVVATSLAVGFLHATLLACVPRVWPARVGTASVVVAHTVWFVTAMPESYGVAILAITVAGWLLVARQMPLAGGAVLALGAFANVLTLFGAPAAIWWLRRRRAADATAFIAGMAAAASAVLLLLLPFRSEAMAGTAEGVRLLQSGVSWRRTAGAAPLMAAYLAYNFASPAAALAIVGWRAVSKEARSAFVLFAAPHYLVALLYIGQRAYLIPIPVYVAMAALVASGADRTLALGRGARPWVVLALVAIAPPIVYLAASVVVRPIGLPIVRDAPFREETAFYLRPWKAGEDSARRYVDAMDRAIPDGSAVLGDFTIVMPLIYAQRVEGWKPNCVWEVVDGRSADTLVSAVAEHLALRRRVFLLDDKPFYHTSDLRRRWTLTPAGVEPLLEVTGRTTAASP